MNHPKWYVAFRRLTTEERITLLMVMCIALLGIYTVAWLIFNQIWILVSLLGILFFSAVLEDRFQAALKKFRKLSSEMRQGEFRNEPPNSGVIDTSNRGKEAEVAVLPPDHTAVWNPRLKGLLALEESVLRGDYVLKSETRAESAESEGAVAETPTEFPVPPGKRLITDEEYTQLMADASVTRQIRPLFERPLHE